MKKNHRQVRGKDTIFIPTTRQLHQISVSERLTVRELSQMYSGIKLAYGINPNLKVPLKNTEGYLVIVKVNEQNRIGVCHNDKHHGLVYIVLKNLQHLSQLHKIFSDTSMINQYCEILMFKSMLKSNRTMLKGYFVNEMLQRAMNKASKKSVGFLTICSKSPDIILIPERNLLMYHCLSNSIKYTVVYINHKQIVDTDNLERNKWFYIPFKVKVLKNKW